MFIADLTVILCAYVCTYQVQIAYKCSCVLQDTIALYLCNYVYC